MEKYRTLFVNSELINGEFYSTYIIQVKKWYGWVTIKTLEGPTEKVVDKTKAIINILKEKI